MQLDDALLLARARRACREGTARQLRVLANLSQEEVASTCGVTSAAVSRWESGGRSPQGRAALAYAQLLARLAAEHADLDIGVGA